MRPLLGTFVEVGVEHEAANSPVAFERAYAAIERVERCLSFHNPDSELAPESHCRRA
jgi:thiamine biosynthesis lipoprotein